MPPPPTATYRLQLGPDLTFAAAASAVPYLSSLGVSHLHLSPVLQAAPGSTHGYDVVDHGRISAGLGGEEGLRSLAATARAAGLGLVVDVVPNHMAVPVPEHLNRPLWSVLREGRDSPYAGWFDIDWEAQDGRMMMPVLGGRLGTELEAISLDKPDELNGETILRYHGHTFPVRPGTEGLPLPDLLRRQWYRLAWWRLGNAELNYRRFFTVSDLIGLRAEDPEVFAATHGLLLRLMDEGVFDGFRIDHPDGLADPGGYLRRLDRASSGRWTVVEKVLADGERLPSGWACSGTTGYDALRHLGGLFVCPEGAAGLERVYADFTAPDREGPPADRGDGSTGGPPGGPGAGNGFPAGYPPGTASYGAGAATGYATRAAYGTTPGYGTGDPAGHGGGCPGDGMATHAADGLADARTDGCTAARAETFAETFEETALHAAREIVTGELAAEADRLTRLAVRICSGVTELSDHSARSLRTAVEELLIAYPVYRPYVVPGEPAPPEAVRDLDRAAQSAVYAFTVPEEAAAVDVVRDLALGALGRGADKDDFTARFAQVCTAVRAKGVEDTAFYRWYPLLSANEVGGDPARPAVAPEEFHAFCARLQRDRPSTGTVLSTHDTKRSADVRARLATLTEAPEAWRSWLAEVSGWYARHRRGGLPDRAAEYLVWQTFVGAGFLHGPDRLLDALRKSLREAGLRTSWTSPDPAYEDAVLGFAADAFPTMLYYAAEFAGARREAERANVLGAALLHLAMPGVPDVYQGTETVARTLVDPDNRRPVDLPGLERRLALQDSGAPTGSLEGEKLHVTAVALRLRRKRPEWFGRDGGYTALPARGPAAKHAVAFSRAGRAVPVVTRLAHRLARNGGFRGTVLPLPEPHSGGEWSDALTGRTFSPAAPVPLDELLEALPVALLVRA